MNLGTELSAMAADGRLDLPPLGGGATAPRWAALVQIARQHVGLGRLAEAHVDGHQILADADRPIDRHVTVGVWASEHPRRSVAAEVDGDRVRLRGSKAFCTGAGLVDLALVTASTPVGPILVCVPMALLPERRIDLSGWKAPALADTATAVVDFEGLELPVSSIVGPPGWYLERPGFWQGAAGPAACWGGAAIGLVDEARAVLAQEPHALAHLGTMDAAAWAIAAALEAHAAAVDADPTDRTGQAHLLALRVRAVVDDRCEAIQRSFERGVGPRALAGDADAIERHAALTLYRRQCHAERDLADLGRLRLAIDASP